MAAHLPSGDWIIRLTPCVILSNRQVTHASCSAPPGTKLPASASAKEAALRSAGLSPKANCALETEGRMSRISVHESSKGRASTSTRRCRSMPRTRAIPSSSESREVASNSVTSGEADKLISRRTAWRASGGIGCVATVGEGSDHSDQPSIMGITLKEHPSVQTKDLRRTGVLVCLSSMRHVSAPDTKYITRQSPPSRQGRAKWDQFNEIVVEEVATASGGMRMRSAVVPVRNGPTSAEGGDGPARLKAMRRKR
mmetsp:Transcript_8709/g.26780  ORF Transcript_8709/g.26780 Transcript_8709/m.26780 type:complete len:254 (+) Transcript_8709:431-1192(+)